MLVETDGVILEMPDDVKEELDDPRFAKRSHYSRATYAKGCHGPLCRLAETHRGRERNAERARQAGREYKPNLTARETEREAELAPIITWHLHERGSR